MAEETENKNIEYDYHYEIPTEVGLKFFDFLGKVSDSTAALLAKHLENEAARLRIREIEVGMELKSSDNKRGPRPVG